MNTCALTLRDKKTMKRIVKYEAVDPYYSDQEQTYIGSSPEEVNAIQWETEEFMAREHTCLSMIYRSKIIFDNTESYESEGTY